MDLKRPAGSGGAGGRSIQMYLRVRLSERTNATRFIMMLGTFPLQIFFKKYSIGEDHCFLNARCFTD